MTRQNVLQAINECDTRGVDDFLGVYGFGPSSGYNLLHEGRSYDPKAILGVAHRYATGRLATSEEFGGDPASAARLLRKRGFEVTEPPSVRRAAPPAPARATTTRSRATSTTPRRVAASDKPNVLCPTCSMALPATGICDYCA